MTLFGDLAVKGLEDDRHKVVTFGALYLLKGLDILMLRAVHNGKNLCHEVGFVTGPLTP